MRNKQNNNSYNRKELKNRFCNKNRKTETSERFLKKNFKIKTEKQKGSLKKNLK